MEFKDTVDYTEILFKNKNKLKKAQTTPSIGFVFFYFETGSYVANLVMFYLKLSKQESTLERKMEQ